VLSSFVKQADALSVKWTLENETTKEPASVIEQTTDQFQKPHLTHSFSTAGKYKISEEIKTDNLVTRVATPPSTSLVVEQRGKPIGFEKEPASTEVVEGSTAEFTVKATGEPAPSAFKWFVKTPSASTFVEDTKDTGRNTPTLKVLASSTTMSGTQYRVEVSDGGAQEAKTSSAATLTVKAKTPPPPCTGECGSQPPPPPPPHEEIHVLPVVEASPTATIAGASASVSTAGAFSIKVSCPAKANCIGSVTVKSAGAVSAKAHGKKSVLTLATGTFNLAGGQSKTLTLHLSATARKVLARSHVLAAKATVVAHNPSGTSKQTTTRTLSLRLIKAKHH
jgi:hypothetical protein